MGMPPKQRNLVENKEKQKRPYRTGTITIEQAKDKFNQYYNTGRSKIGSVRAKKFDKMYQKKPKYQIKCNNTEQPIDGIPPGQCEKGSVKYLLKHGPKTFDINGLDSFEEDTIIKNDDNTQIKSRGSTFKRDIDGDLSDS